jgi:quercetin dioxygenase-like cupin family protein
VTPVPGDDGRDRGRFYFLGGEVALAFAARRVVLAPGAKRAFDEDEWRDAIVFVESGELELECHGGSRRRFRSGDMLWLTGLSLCALRSCGDAPAVLVAVSRQGSDEFRRRPPSNTQ